MKNKYKEEQDYYIIYINYKDNQLECYVDKENFQKVSSIKGTLQIIVKGIQTEFVLRYKKKVLENNIGCII